MARGNIGSRQSLRHGFTLIEILAVLVIIGIVTGITVLSINTLGDRTDGGSAAERLAGLIELASENAQMENVQYGLKIYPHHYVFMQFNGSRWMVLKHHQVLGNHPLPHWMTLTVSTGAKVKLPVAITAGTAASASSVANAATAAVATKKNSGDVPQIAILSTGTTTPFEIRLHANNGRVFVLQGPGNGQVQVHAPGDHASATTD